MSKPTLLKVAPVAVIAPLLAGLTGYCALNQQQTEQPDQPTATSTPTPLIERDTVTDDQPILPGLY